MNTPDDASPGGDAALARDMGAAIRRRRLDLGLTMVELAARCDLSQPFLSKVERGVGRLSMASVDRVARALGTSAVGLLVSMDGAVPVDVLRRADRPSFRAYGMAEGIGQAVTRRAGQLGLAEFADGPAEFPAEPYRHRNDSVCLVLAGGYEFEVDGEVQLLREGDSLSMAGGIGVRYRAVEQPARMLLVLLSEDVQVTHRPAADWDGVPAAADPGAPAP